MHEPTRAPGFLTLFEITASSEEDAIARATRIDSSLANMPNGLRASRAQDAGLYQLIKDVRRNGAP